MKEIKSLLKLLFLLLTISTSYSQEKNEKNKGKESTVKKIKCYNLNDEIRHIRYGTPLCIKVKNINPFLTETFSTYSSIDFDFKTDSFINVNIDNVEKQNEEVTTKMKTNEDIGLFDFNSKVEEMASLASELRYKENFLFLNKDDTEEVKITVKEIDNLKMKIAELNNKLDSLKKSNKYLNKKYDSIYNVTIKSVEFKEAFKSFKSHFNNINNYTLLNKILQRQIRKDSVFIKDTMNFKEIATSNFKFVYGDTINYLNKKEKIKLEIKKLYNTYITLKQKYQELNKLYKNNKLKLSGELKTGNGKTSLKFKNVTASIETEYLFQKEMSMAKAINDSLSKPKIKEQLVKEAGGGINLYKKILKYKYTKTIISENIYKDEAEIIPQIKNSKGKVMHKYRKYKVRTYNRIKINGSAGYFLNFKTDDHYSLRKKVESDPLSKTGIIKENKNRIKSALGGLLHVYYDLKGDVDVGISAGLSLTEESNTAYYLGLSGFFTEKSRLVFTAGMSFLKVDRLNKANLTLDNGIYNFTNESDTEIRYDNVYKPSIFVGISYNLLGNKAKKTEK